MGLAADPAARLEQVRERGLGQHVGGPGVDRHHQVEALGRLLREVGHATDTGDVAQHRQAAPLVDHRSDQRAAGVDVGQVAGRPRGLASSGDDVARGRLDTLGVDVRAPDPSPLGSDAQRGRPADARGGAGDQHDLAGVATGYGLVDVGVGCVGHGRLLRGRSRARNENTF